MWWGTSSTGGSAATTITVTGGYWAQATEFSGLGTLGTTAQNGVTSTGTPQQAIAATVGQLVVAACICQNSITAFTGLTSDYAGTATGPAWRWSSGLDSAYQIVASSATYTPTWTTTTGNTGVIVSAFNAGGGGLVLPVMVSQAVARASSY